MLTELSPEFSERLVCHRLVGQPALFSVFKSDRRLGPAGNHFDKLGVTPCGCLRVIAAAGDCHCGWFRFRHPECKM